MTTHLFLYGTLQPGHRAWHLLAHDANSHVSAHAEGWLYDTGEGYPAVVFGDGGVVHGTRVELVAARAEATLTRLDRYEGPGYRRITVETSGGAALAFEWIGPRRSLVLIENGRWENPDGD